MASNAKNLAEYLNNQTTSATADIADGSITTAKLAADAVTAAKLADNAVVTANISADAVTNAKIANDAIQTENVNSSVNLGRRNVLINGNFDVWQRATSFTDIAGIWKYGHADRWNGHNDAADAGTWSQSTVVPNAGSTYSMLMTGGSSVSNTNFSQRIESTSLKGIREKNSFTISGYVRSATANKVINCHALCPTATDNYSSYTQHNGLMSSVTISGNGGTGTSQITLTDANTWYYFTMTKTSATSLTNFDKGYAVFFSIVGQTSSSHQVYMSQLQIEAGEQATSFEQRSFAEELNLCQRYYYQSRYGNAPTSGDLSFGPAPAPLYHNFPTSMRVDPTVTTKTDVDTGSGRYVVVGVGNYTNGDYIQAIKTRFAMRAPTALSHTSNRCSCGLIADAEL